MDIKQEQDDFIDYKNFEIVFIKHEKDDNPPTKYLQEPHSSGINQITDGTDLVQTNNTKKRLSLDGKSMKKKNPRGRIFLCIICGYMCKKKVEFSHHFSSNHFVNRKNLFEIKINGKCKNKIRSKVIYTDVKEEIEIVDHKFKEELDEIGEHANLLKNIDVCEMHFSSKTDNSAECEICSKDSRQKRRASRFCPIDGKSLECECCFNENLRDHTGEKSDICSDSFKERDNLNMNLHTHSEQKPFKCNVCTKSFLQKGNLNLHLRTHISEKLLICNVCAKSFSKEYNLKRHLRMHTGEKPFECNVCMKSFSEKRGLKYHLGIHTGEKPFRCSVCMKPFSDKRSSKNHLRTHTGEKPFECNVCTKSFSEKRSLKYHLRTHTVKKPLICDVCAKSFSKEYNLKRHLRTHTGEKPFKCNVCMKCLSDKRSLKYHLGTHTGENTLKI